MPVYLDTILEATRARVAAERRHRRFNDLDREATGLPPARDFTGALQGQPISLIGEFKRRSPSRGVIRMDLRPEAAASAYQSGGAKAISVLTEPEFFSGSGQDLQAARSACDLPVLRKDFLLDPYQVVQARVWQADAVLLIAAALRDRGLLEEMLSAAREYGLAALVEVHDEAELATVLEFSPKLVGVNQRDLSTFEVDARLAVKLRPRVPAGVVLVAESGIFSRAQLQELEEAGVDGVLVGEALMRSPDPARAVSELLGTKVH